MAGLEGPTVIGFVGRGAAAEVLGRVLRSVRGGERAAEGFLASGDARERLTVARAARLESLAGARAPGCPVLGRIDWSGDPRGPAGGAVAGLGHLSLAAAGPRGAGASELARRIRDRWVPPLQLAVARALAALPTPVALIVSTAYEPGRLVAAGTGAPLSLAVSEEGVLISSDARVARAFSRRIVFAEPGELAVADSEGFDLLCARTLTRLPRTPSGPGARAEEASPQPAGRWRLRAGGAPAGEAA